MFRDPDEVDESPTASKLERDAAVRRSTIRREPTVRPARHNLLDPLDDVAAVVEARNRRLRRTRLRARRNPDDEERRIQVEEAELERLLRARAASREREREHARLAPHLDDDEDTRTTSSSADRTGFQPRNPTLTAANSAGDPEAERIREIHMYQSRPVRESALRFDFDNESSRPNSRGAPRRLRPYRRYLPRPPYSANSGHLGHPYPDALLRIAHPSADLTPDFAPARPPQDLSRSAVSSHQDPSRPDGDLAADQTLDTSSSADSDLWLPPLTRVNHRSPRPPEMNYDGLGDRRRSPTPSDGSLEEDTWETLLTTMQNGDGPSTHTSFTSSVDSDSASRTQRSSQATSFGEIGQLDDTCDLDLPQGITEEDVREIRARHRGATLRPPRSGVSERELEHNIRRDLERFEQRSIELHLFQNILDRMQRRQEIPNDWWAAVGLSPIIGSARDDS